MARSALLARTERDEPAANQDARAGDRTERAHALFVRAG
jgi:hypothetical protein